MSWNLTIMSHWIFPQSFFFFISGAKSKGTPFKKNVFFFILNYWWFVFFFHINFSIIHIFLIGWDVKNLNSHFYSLFILTVKKERWKTFYRSERSKFQNSKAVFYVVSEVMGPARVAQWWASTHDLVVMSSIPVWGELTFRVFSPLTSAEACEKSSRWLWKEKLC